jgi:Ca2+-binding RTX toxin-like protein
MNSSFLPDATALLSGYGPLDGTAAADLLQGTAGPDRVVAGLAADTVSGGGGGDLIYGGAGSSFTGGPAAQANAADGGDLLFGNGGNDLIDGGGGDDWLNGGIGGDTLIGGLGADRLTGGDGADLFLFGLTPLGPDTGLGPARDVIRDFRQGEDLIGLTGYRGDLGTPEEGLMFLGNGPLTAQAHGALRWEFRGGNTLVQLDLDLPWQAADGVADAEILLLGRVALTGADFLL